jgi:hypothetical protein
MHSHFRSFTSGFLIPHRPGFVLAIILSLVGLVAQLLLPILSITVIDRAIPRHNPSLLWKTTTTFTGWRVSIYLIRSPDIVPEVVVECQQPDADLGICHSLHTKNVVIRNKNKLTMSLQNGNHRLTG